jgi:hypothetical protein
LCAKRHGPKMDTKINPTKFSKDEKENVFESLEYFPIPGFETYTAIGSLCPGDFNRITDIATSYILPGTSATRRRWGPRSRGARRLPSL